MNETIKEHARLKKVPENHVTAVLFRVADGTNYAYWEEPLDYGSKDDYKWSWNEGETLKGVRNGQIIFQWYSKNQKQLFYRWQVPKNAVFFKVTPVKCITIAESELENERKKWYMKGYADAQNGQKENE